jgi:Fe2+ transport system protein FeoA
VICPLCGFAYDPGGDACRAHACPLAWSGCRTLHCPRCGHSAPDERASRAARFIRRLFASRPSAGRPRTLSDLPRGAEAVVARLQGPASLLGRLTAQGLAPGVRLRLVERAPSFVVEMGETILAFERSVAEAVELREGTD